MSGAPVALLSLATAQFRRFFDSGRAIRCLLPLGGGGLIHLVVLCGYQGADSDAEQLALTEQLFDAAMGELGVVARGENNVEPTQMPCLATGISAGLWVDLAAAWALAGGTQPAATCTRTWDSAGDHRGEFMVGCPLAAAVVSSCRVELDRWIAPHLAVRAHFDCVGWTCQVTQSAQRAPLWPASWLPAIDKSRGSKSVEVQRVWEIIDDRLQFMARSVALLPDESLRVSDVSCAWLVWSGAAETAVADAYQFAGGPVPVRGLVVVRDTARFRVVRLGGPKILKARCNVADALYRSFA